MVQDIELIAMNNVYDTFKGLDNGQRMRIVDWVIARFGLTEEDKFKAPVETATPTPAPVQPAPAPVADAEKPVESTGFVRRDIKDYDKVIDLFSESSAKKVSQKIILMTAFLQERLNFAEVSSYDINSRLKRIKQGVANVTSSINGVLKKTPPLLEVVEGKGEEGSHRRKFRLTPQGLEFARSLMHK